MERKEAGGICLLSPCMHALILFVWLAGFCLFLHAQEPGKGRGTFSFTHRFKYVCMDAYMHTCLLAHHGICSEVDFSSLHLSGRRGGGEVGCER